MATFLVGIVLAIALYFALRHVARNIKEGREDCAGCAGCKLCGEHGCHPQIPAK